MTAFASRVACIDAWPISLVGISGSRQGHPDVRKWMMAWVDKRGPATFVLGGGPTTKKVAALGKFSVDEDARRICELMEWPFVELPALWSTRLAKRVEESGAAAGPARNGDMAKWASQASQRALLAFPCPESKGTWDCVKRFRRAGIPVHVNWSLVPDDPRRREWRGER
jgi:hypothetical protein